MYFYTDPYNSRETTMDFHLCQLKLHCRLCGSLLVHVMSSSQVTVPATSHRPRHKCTRGINSVHTKASNEHCEVQLLSVHLLPIPFPIPSIDLFTFVTRCSSYWSACPSRSTKMTSSTGPFSHHAKQLYLLTVWPNIWYKMDACNVHARAAAPN